MAKNFAVTWSFCLICLQFSMDIKKKNSRDFLVPTVWTAIFCVQIPPVIPFSFVCLYTYLCEGRATFIPHLNSPQEVGGVQWKPVESLAELWMLSNDPFTGNNEFVNLSVIKITGLHCIASPWVTIKTLWWQVAECNFRGMGLLGQHSAPEATEPSVMTEIFFLCVLSQGQQPPTATTHLKWGWAAKALDFFI